MRLVGGAAVTWPLAARAQQTTLPVIGYLSSRSPSDSAHIVAAFRQGLTAGDTRKLRIAPYQHPSGSSTDCPSALIKQC